MMRGLTISRRRFFLMSAGAVAWACAPASTRAPAATRAGDGLVALYADPTKNQWPSEFLQLPAETQTMYRYAAANEATLKWFPCYCGCVAAGHRSNFDCYVREVLADGRIRLDTMSFG